MLVSRPVSRGHALNRGNQLESRGCLGFWPATTSWVACAQPGVLHAGDGACSVRHLHTACDHAACHRQGVMPCCWYRALNGGHARVIKGCATLAHCNGCILVCRSRTRTTHELGHLSAAWILCCWFRPVKDRGFGTISTCRHPFPRWTKVCLRALETCSCCACADRSQIHSLPPVVLSSQRSKLVKGELINSINKLPLRCTSCNCSWAASHSLRP